jgi:hypothetical protein
MNASAAIPTMAYATSQSGASLGFRLADSTGAFLYVDKVAEIRSEPIGARENAGAEMNQVAQLEALMNEQFRQMGLGFNVSIDTQGQEPRVTVQSIDTGSTVRTMDFSELLKIGQTLGMAPNTLVSQTA